jgi:hypothetical protein
LGNDISGQGKHRCWPASTVSPGGNGVITRSSALCPEISRAERSQSPGREIVLEEPQRHVRAHGFPFEPSIYDHVYAIDFFLHAIVLANLNELAIPNGFEKTLKKMLDA